MQGAATGNFSELLLGLCAGALLAMAAAMLRAPRPAARWTGFAFFFTSALFAIKLWCDGTQAFPMEIRMVIGVVALTSVGWFWLMVMALFDDKDEFRPIMFAAPAGLLLFGILGWTPEGPLHPVIWTGSTILQAGLAIAALALVLRSWKDDLVESRRRIRGPFMIAVSLYILSLNGFDLWEMIGEVPQWYPMVNAFMLSLCVLSGAFAFLEARGAMFGAETPKALPASPAPPARAVPAASELAGSANGRPAFNGGSAAAFDRAAKADLDRLEMLMSTQQVWKEEGLTIAGLALRAGIPESQLRRLINDCLGYRNFPSYVNAHRIAAAKTRLADPSEARVSISTIAYDIGFASLGPFNRAFREETGVAPSEWRRSALHEPSPIPEKV
jgi:AraC-like DNA-binding protein